MRDQLKSYYANKKIFWRIILILLFVLLIIFQVSGGKKWLTLSTYTSLNFAGETMPHKWSSLLNIERFDREVALAQINEAQFRMIYKRWNLIIPMIETQLTTRGLPDDLKYLAIVESALRENVTSAAGAAGLWQLMPDTAKRYGLVINDYVDERFDIQKSTTAALDYLEALYKKFGNWTLVAAAYNRWENGLQTTLTNQYSTNYYDLWLNNETSRYIFRILAMKYLWEHKQHYFDLNMFGDMYTPIPTRSISVKSIENIALWAKQHHVWYYEVKKMNPRILKNSLPEGQRTIAVIGSK